MAIVLIPQVLAVVQGVLRACVRLHHEKDLRTISTGATSGACPLRHVLVTLPLLLLPCQLP